MESFEEIYSLYFKDIYRYVLSLCRNSEQAEEITQETFFQAMKSISSFRGDCKMTVWLCQIAKHLYFAQKRKEKHSAIMTLDEVSDHLPDTTSQPLELRIADETDAMRILEYLHDIETGDGENWAATYTLPKIQKTEDGESIHIKEIYYGTENDNILIWSE